MNTYFRFVSIFFLLFTSFLLAQNSKDSILVYTYAEKNSISLKWLITSKDLYVQAKKSGFEVTRFSLKYVDNKPQLTNPVKITPVPIKPMPFDRIKANAEVYPDLKKALFFEASEQLMDKKFETYEESYTAQDYSSLYLGFGIFSVASYNIVAKVTGMYYEDKGVNTALECV
jgi:hypothetical protein